MRFLFWFLAIGLTPTGVDATPDYWFKARSLDAGESLFQLSGGWQHNSGVSAQKGVQSSAYSKRITWAQVESSLQPDGRVKIERYRSQNKLNQNATVANYSYEVSNEVYGIAPGWGYGLSPEWSFGFRIPIRITKQRAHSRLEVDDSTLSVIAKSQGVSASKYRERLALMGRAARAELSQQTNSRDNHIEMGDIEILNKVRLPSVGETDWALLGTIRFPAAPNNNPYDGLFVQDDSGQFDLGLCANWTVRSESRWQFSGSVGYLVQLADRQNVSWRERELKQPEVVRDVRRDLGDIGFANLSSEYWINERFKVLGGYRVEKKGADEFRMDQRAEPWIFEYQSSQSGQIGLSYLFGQEGASRAEPLQSVAHLQLAKIFSGEGSKEDLSAEIFLEWFY
ncbi:hypothetical protein OAQ84_00035 [Bdellovibrionales bacterium]|nr:hypothetical protein [Bdellovibrionales bacterium]